MAKSTLLICSFLLGCIHGALAFSLCSPSVETALLQRHHALQDHTASRQQLHYRLRRQQNQRLQVTCMKMVSPSDDEDEKFGAAQRIASVQSLVVGAVSGSLALAVPEFVHQTILDNAWSLTPDGVGGMVQFEFDTDMGAVVAGLFAIVYRYCVRLDGDREQLKQGVVGAFTLTRALSRITVPVASCSAFPLSCGPPLGYVNWNMILQLGVNGVESGIMFAAAAVAMDYCMTKGWIIKFPG
mmetsp:Transcript_2721/g.3665  ORF Transcript_2721/g.3665 Transcript_2721/m.3665 type:complete len:241 (+) Transcript_2721:79-801(+)